MKKKHLKLQEEIQRIKEFSNGIECLKNNYEEKNKNLVSQVENFRTQIGGLRSKALYYEKECRESDKKYYEAADEIAKFRNIIFKLEWNYASAANDNANLRFVILLSE